MFKSFIMGGYECADHINRSGKRINLLKETQHDIRVDEDYQSMIEMGIMVVREGICWSNVEISPGNFDFSEVKNRIKCGEKYGIQQIWDLIHFGYPNDIYPTHPHFSARFVSLCDAFAKFYRETAKDALYVVPINEISFLAWFSGEARGTVPFTVNSGWDIKYHLCKAAILGIEKLREILPDCRIILVEPLVKVHAGSELDTDHVANMNEYQYQAMDIISGKICPELGGKPQYLDILGFNYYWNCQWEHNSEPLEWPVKSCERRISLSELLSQAYERYQTPFFISETGHFGDGRVQWLKETMDECHKILSKGLPLHGICIYPVTDRPDWDNLEKYFNCGIFDLDAANNRIPHAGSVEAILEMQNSFK